MRKAALAIGACLIGAGGCGGGDLYAPANASLIPAPSLSALYALTAINGHTLPCCSHATSDGTTERWGASEIHFTGPDTYTWTVELQFDWQPGPHDFRTAIVDSVVSSGHYSRRGSSLSFSDSATSRAFGATLVNDTIAVTYAGSTYRFRPVPPPGVSASQWSLVGACVDANGNLVGCPVTNDSGVVATEIGGMLQFDYNTAEGHYVWGTQYEDRHPDGTTTTRDVTSSGTYLWDGTTVTMKDSSTGATMTGHFDGSPGRLRVEAGTGAFEFHRLFELP